MTKNKSEAPRRRAPARQKREQARRRQRLLRLGGLAVLILLVFMVLATGLLTNQVSYTVGEIVLEDLYYSGTATSYESALATEKARNEAAALVGQIFVTDDSVTRAVTGQLKDYELLVRSYAEQVGGYSDDGVYLSSERLIPLLRDGLPGNYTDASLQYMLDLSGEEVSSLFQLFVAMVEKEYTAGVSAEDVEDSRENIAYAISASSITGEGESFFKSLLEVMDLPYNKAYDAVATRSAQDAAMEAVSPILIYIQPGQKLLARGAAITPEQIEGLEALGLLSSRLGRLPYLGLLVLVSLLLIMFFYYLRQFKRAIYDRPALLLLIGALLLLFLLLAKLISCVEFGAAGEASRLICFLAPMPAASMLLTVLMDRNTAILGTCVLAVGMGVIAGGSLVYALVPLLGGLVGLLAASRLSQRSQFVEASLTVAGANVLVIVASGLIWSENATLIGIGSIFGLVNGLLSAILAMGLLPFLESAFDVTTSFRLLELSNSNNPLLKRLMMEAPGTYNHSILVGNLAEAAADAIGANPLLVRVAAYYHDVGKLKRPHFFIENQRPGENPHDKLQPSLSAMIITAHTSDGVRLLREARLPREVIDIVEQHHGNSLLAYFYRKAQSQTDQPQLVSEADYRYHNPRPQSREAGLLMLADSVQAAIQALKTADRLAVEQRVHEVIQGKLNQDDQLWDCPLTLRDLDQTEQAFLLVLSGINHQRIAYPPELPGEKSPESVLSAASPENRENAEIIVADGDMDRPQ